jgi:hypothetical protein
LQSSISGTSAYYAGGGGGGGYVGTCSITSEAGGLGGGGTGYCNSQNGGSGTANTGGGGGGDDYYNYTGGAGGSGIVIISAPVSSGITATGGTLTVSGGNDIWTFTSSGTWTPTVTVPTPTFVQSNQSDSGYYDGGFHWSVSQTFGSNTTAGNTLIVGVTTDNGTDVLSGISDTQGNHFALVAKTTSPVIYLYYATSTVGGADTIKTTFTTSTTPYFLIHEYAGLLAPVPLDTSFTTNANTATIGPLTTATSNELLFGLVGSNNRPGAGTGFTNRAATAYNIWFQSFDNASQLTGSPGSYSMTLINTSAVFSGILAAFK